MERLWTSLCARLPDEVAVTLQQIGPSLRERAQEIRLRVGMPLTVSTADGDRGCGDALSARQVQECFLHLCGYAVHAHQEELSQGFFTIDGGVRIGVAGAAVMRDGVVTAYRDITSLCIRIPRMIAGCAASLLPYILGDRGLHGMLLCGVPATGKTTLLRDLAMSLSRSYRVTVVDERCELAMSGMASCDVLRGCPKAVGILQAVRTLAPDVIVADEIGGDAEWQAVMQAAFCGVPMIASVHASCERDLSARRVIWNVLQNGGFSYAAFLPPRGEWLRPIRIREVAQLFENHRSNMDRDIVHGSRCSGDISADTNRETVAGMGGTVAVSVHGFTLYGKAGADDPCCAG